MADLFLDDASEYNLIKWRPQLIEIAKTHGIWKKRVKLFE